MRWSVFLVFAFIALVLDSSFNSVLSLLAIQYGLIPTELGIQPFGQD